ncbi:MAG: glycosyltransferase [Deltaproteobacteria bacterium]|nr:glycosyltransferase [Deltaproteobacteria bacterium]
MKDLISVIVVNDNALKYLVPCFASLLKVDKDGYSLEIIMVDNLSQDGSVPAIRDKFPEIKIIENTVNNYAKALNLGIDASTGSYVGVLNPDTVVEKNWLTGILDIMAGDDRIGVVQSKILFSDEKTINSVGVEEVGDFYFRDIGFDEKDAGQYEKPMEINFFSGGSVFFRRDCLVDVGSFDEDFVMYMENIDYSIRCRDKGWSLFYSPKSVVYHKYHGVTSTGFCEYYSSRNKMLLRGKHFPFKLPGSIKTSQFYLKNDMENLYRSLIQAVKKVAEYQPTEIIVKVLDDLKDIVQEVFGPRRAANFFSQLEVVLGLRKIKVGIYDHAFHLVGGGQRYAAKLAENLQDKYDITYIANKDITLEQYKEWFDIDLSNCKLKIIKIPFFEKAGWNDIDEGAVINKETNPFDIISQESLKYDIFINANMLTKVKPLSTLSIFICHFPDREKERFFSVDKYDYILTNGNYGSFWVKQRWGLDPTLRLYPPVDMYHGAESSDKKSKIILSVTRFEACGSKKQLEMIRAFRKLCKRDHRVKREWRFIIAGSSAGDNPYFNKVKREINAIKSTNIELMSNLTNSDILKLYAEASIFWHACGLGEKDPHLVEHFGMTTVEAMQNYCVPIVINGGGQREIVEHEISGFLFSTVEELISCTLKVIDDDGLRKRIAQEAYEKSHRFNADMFTKNALSFFANVENRLRGGEPLIPCN